MSKEKDSLLIQGLRALLIRLKRLMQLSDKFDGELIVPYKDGIPRIEKLNVKKKWMIPNTEIDETK